MATSWPPRPAARIPVRVSPKACGDEVAGWVDGALDVRVAAQPRRGRANAAVERLLAEVLGVTPSQVRVVSGHAARRKLVEIDDMDDDEIERRLPGRWQSRPDGGTEPWRTARH
ncbi:MAG TPA: DUF167 domain-containing protein [Gammaproteobacteria bacterium]